MRRVVSLVRDATTAASAVSGEYLQQVVTDKVPFFSGTPVLVSHLVRGHCVLQLPYSTKFVRPGGTITGPAMFGLADLALYGAVLSCIGPVELAVTTSMTINFLRKPGAGMSLVADARVVKLGKRLAFGDIFVYGIGAVPSSDGQLLQHLEQHSPCAHVSGTYSIPPLPSHSDSGSDNSRTDTKSAHCVQ